ncbi:MAG TPA: S8 family serine peptidase [Acidimicrobiales bacterium]|nr:S8 family serine peptidase [Acidimicrobiales bacterium]
MGWRKVVAALAPAVLVVLAAPAHASNDPAFAQLWNIQKIKAPTAWATSTGANVRVGIVDTGVDLSHPDLAGRIAATVTCSDDSGDPSHCSNGGQDIEGHGTHVSGIIAADKDNGVGVVGVAPSARLYVANAFHNDPNDSNCQPCANINDIAAGIRWLTSVAHVQVINLSLGDSSNGLLGTGLFRGPSNLRTPVEEAWQGGAIPVIAAGNDGGALFGSSANYGTLDAIVVGASGPNDEAAFYSSDLGNAKWAMVAPGGDAPNGCSAQPSLCVLSTFMGGKYSLLQGTSMATPHVTGGLALLLARGLSREQAVNTILATADKQAASWCGCSGRLDVAAAVATTGSAGGGGGGATTPPPGASPGTTARTRTTSAPRTGGTAGPTPTTGLDLVTPAPNALSAGVPPAAVTTTTAPRGQVAAAHIGSPDDKSISGGLAALGLTALIGAAVATAAMFRRRRGPA